MEVFLTGATGYIGHVVAEKLVARGDTVIGLARSEAAADTLRDRGVQPVAGDLDQPDALTTIASAADAVIHLGFQWGSDVTSTIAAERRVVEGLMAGVAGRDARLLFPGGTSVLGDTGDAVFAEDTPIAPHPLAKRLNTERLVLNASTVHGIVIRAPNVYGRGDGQALFAALRQAGRSLDAIPFPAGAGDHLWSFVHVDDLAALFVLALDRAAPHQLFHAGAQSGLRTRDIAAAVSAGMGWDSRTAEMPLTELRPLFPVSALADYWSTNSQSSRAKAERLLDWRPRHLNLLGDVARNLAG